MVSLCSEFTWEARNAHFKSFDKNFLSDRMKKVLLTFSSFGIGPLWLFSFSLFELMLSLRTVFNSTTSFDVPSRRAAILSIFSFWRFTVSPSSLMLSNNCRISRLETIIFSRFLKLELDRGSRTADAFEVDEAVIVLIGGRLDEDDRLLELALPEKNESLEIDEDISLKTE